MRRTSREAYTLFELLIVLAVLVILGTAITMTFDGNYANTRQKAAAESIRSHLAVARAKAMEEGNWYRLAIHADGTRIRLGPDGSDFASRLADNPPSLNSRVIEEKFENGVTAEVIFGADDEQERDLSGEWITVATVGPEGVCKEDGAIVRVREGNATPIDVRIRGLIGSAKIVPPQANGGMP